MPEGWWCNNAYYMNAIRVSCNKIYDLIIRSFNHWFTVNQYKYYVRILYVHTWH